MRVINGATQINIFDDRFYFIQTDDVPTHLEYLKADGGVYLPSSTHILDVAYSKGKQYEEWLKSVGSNAKIISAIAAEKGSRCHAISEMLFNGMEVSYDMNVEGDYRHIPPHLGLDEWMDVLKVKEFYEQASPKVLKTESIVYNLEYGYAGTVDLICEIDGEVWLIDLKFGNYVHESYFLQIESYARCLEGIDRVGVLHMKSATRGEDKKGKKIQGKGWRLEEPPVDRETLFNTWKALLEIYKFKNEGSLPRTLSVDKKIKLWD